MLRSVFSAAAGSARLGRLAASAPLRRIAGRYVPGPHADDALTTARRLADDGLAVSLSRLGAPAITVDQARSAAEAYADLLGRLPGAGLAAVTEVSVRLSDLGLQVDDKLALEQAAAVCAAAAAAGAAVTLDAEDHTTVDSTCEILAGLRRDHPGTGVALAAHLRRTAGDCRELATAGSRVRLCKGAHAEPESVAFTSALDIDKSFVRCLNILMSGEGYPMVATHDPRLIAIAEDRARWFDRRADEFEVQLLHGVRPAEQARLSAGGTTVRVYLPYGDDWYGYVMRRIAAQPVTAVLRKG